MINVDISKNYGYENQWIWIGPCKKVELRVIAAWSWILLILLHYLAKFGDDDDDDDYDDDDLWTNGDDNDYDHDDYQNSL